MNEIISDCVNRAAACFGVAASALFSRERREPISTARKVAMVLSYERLRNYCVVARAFDRNPASVAFAVRTMQADYLTAAREGRPVSLGKPELAGNGGRCACGNPATLRERKSSWVCERCHAIEVSLYRH